mmetsp:Transcript_14361/g.38107  ORF Transcript_14361/g.38107 Transcript_14361/m.38107 type:complete len:143 (+) Transcript_14361:143-571(+)
MMLIRMMLQTLYCIHRLLVSRWLLGMQKHGVPDGPQMKTAGCGNTHDTDVHMEGMKTTIRVDDDDLGSAPRPPKSYMAAEPWSQLRQGRDTAAQRLVGPEVQLEVDLKFVLKEWVNCQSCTQMHAKCRADRKARARRARRRA